MVHLVLSSQKGNQGLRYFPHTGYLGLTPVTVEGVVRTRRDDDPRQLLASSLTVSVRCYESRVGRVSVLHSKVLADFTTLLWSKPDGQEYAPIDEVEFPFRITIPPNAPGFSTTVFVDYRCMWRVEAIINHAPISVIGSRQIKHFELPLVRHDVPPCLPTSFRSSKMLFQSQTSKPKVPRIRYTVHAPTSPIGPLDIVSIPISLLPLDDDCVIRSASLIIERHIQLSDFPDSASSMHTPSCPIPSSKSSSSRPYPSPSSPSHARSNVLPSPPQEPSTPSFNPVASVASDISLNPTITSHSIYSSTSTITSDTRPLPPSGDSATPLPNSPSMSSKFIVNSIVAVESSGQFSRDSQGVWAKTITLQWPAAKSHSRWAIGETIQSDLISVKFFARVKISISSANGTESIDLSEKELLVVSTNEAERQIALAKYNDRLSSFHSSGAGRSKSKSPRRIRRDRDADVPPSPAPFQGPMKFPSGGTESAEELSTEQSSSSPKVARPRRPHTSAGPRDKPYYFAGGTRPDEHVDSRGHVVRQRTEGQNDKGVHPAATEASQSVPSKRRSGLVGNFFSSSPRITTAPSVSSSSGTTTTNSSASGCLTRSTSSSVSSTRSLAPDEERDDRMREWEKELTKIEVLSRKSSDMLGFSWLRKRYIGASQQQQA